MGFLNSCDEPVKTRVIAVLGKAGLPPYPGDQGLEQGSRACRAGSCALERRLVSLCTFSPPGSECAFLSFKSFVLVKNEKEVCIK